MDYKREYKTTGKRSGTDQSDRYTESVLTYR